MFEWFRKTPAPIADEPEASFSARNSTSLDDGRVNFVAGEALKERIYRLCQASDCHMSDIVRFCIDSQISFLEQHPSMLKYWVREQKRKCYNDGL